jgi:hypothetical protein
MAKKDSVVSLQLYDVERDSRANGISERESNNQPDCEDGHGIGHAFTEFP